MPHELKISKTRKLSGKLTPSHLRSKAQEREAAQRMVMVPGSGNGAVKGDCRLKSIVRLECKTTRNKSFSVTRGMLEKIEAAAVMSAETPALEIEFCDKHGNPQLSCLIMPKWALTEFIQMKRQEEAT